ncbi:MAG: hypothetical protein LBJ94_00500 [Puniceicoccales bacterium]|jgi:hypothetical protein|nr:hypothetical protein [Puniceicoccales bacterium]
MDSSGMVEVFSTGIISCAAPRDVADKFHSKLTKAERLRISNRFVEDQGIIFNGNWRYFFCEEDRLVDVRYSYSAEDRITGNSILCRIIELEIEGENIEN